MGVRDDARYEGEAAILLEAAADQSAHGAYAFGLTAGAPIVIDPAYETSVWFDVSRRIPRSRAQSAMALYAVSLSGRARLVTRLPYGFMLHDIARDGTLLITSAVPEGRGITSTDWPQPQHLDSDMGKVLRINTDGSVPNDNPFVGRAGARPEIFALGFRDDQGIAIHPRTGALWLSEHGPRGGDEINIVDKGKNYGFPEISYGHDYSGRPLNNDRTAAPGMEQPAYFWTPDIGPAGITFYTGALFPAWLPLTGIELHYQFRGEGEDRGDRQSFCECI